MAVAFLCEIKAGETTFRPHYNAGESEACYYIAIVALIGR
jgi:hypothetical protein